MKKYYKYINTLFVVTPMTCVMALVAILKNNGFTGEWINIFFTSWLTMLPIAYLLAFIILPLAKRSTDSIIYRKKEMK